MNAEQTFQAAFELIRSEFPDWTVQRASMDKDDFRRGPLWRNLRASHTQPSTDSERLRSILKPLGIIVDPVYESSLADITEINANLELRPDRPLDPERPIDIDLPMMEGKWTVDPGPWGKTS